MPQTLPTEVERPAARTAPATAAGLDAAYAHCWRIATSHYENFTVGSWLLPRRLRRHIAAVYAFARTADDLADEGSAAPAERLRQLAAWEEELDLCWQGRPRGPIFVALADTAEQFALPVQPFRDLLTAFRRDVEFAPFATFDDLLGYCRCSADPVGRLILYLFGYRDEERQRLSDRVCTGLQLTNFWQDVAVDAGKGRLYLPLEDLTRFGCSAEDVSGGALTPALRELMAFEVGRARQLLESGAHLRDLVERRLGREVYLFASGGLAILRKIEAVGYDVFSRRPKLGRWEKAALVLRAGAGLSHTTEGAP